ncbi:MAG: ribose 5-phosphate isomerase B [Rhodospirillales bacterium]|nr:ribose 5-phosphate isomerase B [Rhodospirillales bacterium]MCB9995505.1 ribose 5-phosphate isomerase B [Rhodospirillales bacterium]
MQKVAIASDHAGYQFKESLKEALDGRYEWLDLGTHGPDSVDYPDYGHAMGEAIKNGDADKGILICGSGIGISIAANRHPEVRAALCTNDTMARLSRQHNDANVLALGARIIGFEVALDCVDAFMSTDFEGGRHARRVEKI